MGKLYTLGCRIYQIGMHWAMYLLPWREPALLESLQRIPGALEGSGCGKALIITDQGVASAGLLAMLEKAMGNFSYVVYDRTEANPTVDMVEEARSVYTQAGCDALIALGGGSPMDCAKGVGARIARPDRPLSRMRGQIKVWRKIPPLVAIPTTSGTGSETTLAAVITDKDTHEKYAVNDPVLIPRFAVLDPSLTTGLPPRVTATTGMDALTHAVEAFIGRSNTAATKRQALKAIRLIDRHLLCAYRNGHDLSARAGMQQAAYLAGAAFTRAFVGYVHAIAHQLGALYGVAHGLANAILLPHVLAFYGGAAHGPLCGLSESLGITGGGSMAERANAVIQKIEDMNRAMDIPRHVREIRPGDVARIVEGAHKEANPLYPVPRILDKGELEALVKQIME